jgi:hypothetical protein
MPSGIFPKVVGELIYAADYNTIQSVVDSVMGLGSSDEGYGQAITSSQLVPATTAQVIQWVRLRTDMILARQHQTGVDESASLTAASSALSISATVANQYYNFSNISDDSRLNIVNTKKDGWSILVLSTIGLNLERGDNILKIKIDGSNSHEHEINLNGCNIHYYFINTIKIHLIIY